METPIVDFVENYTKSNKARLHMPGHKGVPFLGIEQSDITEIKGADELYSPEGIILRSEQNASALFSTQKTVYSAGGSTQSIHAMLYLAKIKSKSKTVFAARNAHKAFHYACAKLECNIHWLYPEKSSHLCSCVITQKTLTEAFEKADTLPFAVYITSPDYLGKMADIKALSAVCRQYNVPLLVDNAHGSYLAFCEKNLHPIALGADMCCDSAHKTLPVLTGGGYLHIAKDNRFGFAEHAVQAMSIFGSTSPSYLILQSLDLCNRYIDGKIKDNIKACRQKIEEIRAVMPVADFSDEPLKITADMRCVANRDVFEKAGIEPEFVDDDFTVFMLTPQNSDGDIAKLKEAFTKMQIVKIICEEPPVIPRGVQKISVRDAIFSLSETVEIQYAVGRICAAPTVSCPPAIPIAVSGEEITPEHIELFKKYNINRISVVKE